MSEQRKSAPERGDVAAPIQAHLGEQLRKYYAAIVAEPVPDKFAALLDELERRERNCSPADEETAR